MIGFLGFIIHLAAKHDPWMSAMYIDSIGAMICWLVPIMLVMWRLKAGQCYEYFKAPQKNKPLFDFLYRVGELRTVHGNRLPGTSFSTVKKLGIIQEIGVPGEGVFRRGDKPTQMILQDLAHTPNPKWFNFTHWLTRMGFTSIEELAEVWDGYNPGLMVKVWNNMQNTPQREPAELFMGQVTNLSKEHKALYNAALKKQSKKSIMTKEGFVEDFSKDMNKMGGIFRRKKKHAIQTE